MYFFGEGFIAGTLVKTVDGYKPIETLVVGDIALCCDVRNISFSEKKITAVESWTSNKIIQVTINKTKIFVDYDHEFYIPMEQLWFKALNLVPGTYLLNTSSEFIEIENIKRIENSMVVYNITVEKNHTFCVSEEDIVVHNFVFALPALVWGSGIAIMEGITLAKLGAALTTAAVCYIAQRSTGKSLNVEIGANGTVNGRSLTRSEDKNNKKNVSSATVCAGGGGEPWPRNNFSGNDHNFYGKKPGDIESEVNQTSEAILRNGYYEVNGFRFSEYYYNRLWNTGRKAPTFIVEDVLRNATKVLADKYPGCFRYETAEWELVYNPTTKTVHHLAPIN